MAEELKEDAGTQSSSLTVQLVIVWLCSETLPRRIDQASLPLW